MTSINKSMIVIGDVHGCFDTLIALIKKFPPGVPFAIAGDLIDRGPKSREVVEFVKTNNIPVVKGNHEDMMAYGDSYWKQNGGYQALESYGCQTVQTSYSGSIIYFPDPEKERQFVEHQEWMKTLPLILEFPDIVNAEGRYLVITHSNICNFWKSYKKDKDTTNKYFQQNVLWGRPHTIKDAPEIYNIHGHTPQQDGPKIKVPFANVDTGCVFKHHEGYGVLTALQYPEMIVYTQECIDDY